MMLFPSLKELPDFQVAESPGGRGYLHVIIVADYKS